MKASLPTPSCSCFVGPPLPAELAASCRVPVLVLWFCAVAWLASASLLGVLSSLKFHVPGLLADHAWLTYGRVQPAQATAFVYGFGLQAGWGITLWLLVRLGRARLRLPALAIAGALLWNVGVKAGLLGILAGAGTGFEGFDLPGFTVPILFMAATLLGISALLTFRDRAEPGLYVSHWFLLAALFWFPWIYTTAAVLLVMAPVRGVMQSLVTWWYVANLHQIALGFVGLATLFYAIPRLLERSLHSQHLALAAFWMLALFASWTGIPDTAPLPSWIPGVSTVFAVLLVVPWVAVALNLHRTLAGHYRELRQRWPLSLAVFSGGAYVVAVLLLMASSLPAVNQWVQFTFFGPARIQLFLSGFFAMAMFTGLYLGLPDLVAGGLPSGRLVKLHVWCVGIGLLLCVVPLLGGGVAQGRALNDAARPFLDAFRPGLMALRISTLGDILLLVGNVALLLNFILAGVRGCRACCLPIIAAGTRPTGEGAR
jgi:cytochrome c oxidase cbb3-type subunit 1